jgi:uncharacterized repeat protein (TIGR01451 family)
LTPIADQVFENAVNGVQGLLGAAGMAMDGNGRHLYVAGSFDASIAIFQRDPTGGELTYAGRVQNAVDGVSGLSGIRDLAVSPDNGQVLGVGFGTTTSSLVVFDRETAIASPEFGGLNFVQALTASDSNGGIGLNPMALAIPGGSATGAGDHVYVASHASNSVSVLRRITDPSSSAFGKVEPVVTLFDNQGGISHMGGPRDVRVSPDGKRVYVAAENSSALLMFDRDLNASAGTYGRLSLVETRRDNVDGVDGLGQVRALAVSGDSRNVYAAAFSDRAISSFRLGIGSVCSASGSGNIDDLVDIGVQGTLVYRASATIRPDATGLLSNTASISLPATFQPVNPDSGCPVQEGDAQPADFCATDTTELVPAGDVSVTKSSDVVSVVAGESVRYQVVIRNPGPSNLVHEVDYPLTLTDDLDANPGFVAGSSTWTCQASGSGALEFVSAYDQASGFAGLSGISSLALVPAASGATGSPFELLAGASVLEDSLALFRRDPVDGALSDHWVITGPNLLGARSVAATSDGRHLYVASRVADSVSVFALDDDGSGGLEVDLVAVEQGWTGLDQAVHLVLSQDESFLYVAGANDNAIAVFARNSTTGQLDFVETVQQGINGVQGLLDVNYLLASPDGNHLYALSPATASVSVFERDAGNGQLTFLQRYAGGDLGVNLAGLSSAVIDSGGEYMYLSAGLANSIVVLARDTSGGGSHGALAFASSVTQSDDDVAGLAGVRRLALSADDIHLYATSQSGDSIAWFVRDGADGSLRFGGMRSNLDASVTGLQGATGVVVDGQSNQVYVAGTLQAAISQFSRQVDSFCPASGTGSLMDVPFNIAAGGTVTFVIDVDVNPDHAGELINEAVIAAARDDNTANHTATVSNVVAVVADLSISKDDGLSEFDGLAGASAVDGFDKHLYVAGTGDNAIGVYARAESTGGAVFGQPPFVQIMRSGENGVSGLTGVLDVGVSADGAHVYAVSPMDNALVVTRRDPLTGRIEFLEIQQNGTLGVSGMSGANSLAFSPDDRHIYVTGGFANAIAIFSRDADPQSSAFGRLEFRQMRQEGVDSVTGLAGARAVAVSPDGRHVYALGTTADTVAAFVRNPTPGSANFGQLGFIEHYSNQDADTAGLNGVRDLVISPDGQFVYVLGNEDGTLVQFLRDSGDGRLEFVEFLQDGFGSTAGLRGARRLVFTADGQSLIAVGGADGSLARYAVSPDDGRLTWVEQINDGDEATATGGQVFGLDGASDAWATPDDEQFFVTSAGRDAVIGFRRQSSEPTLQFADIVIDGLGGVAPGESVTYLIIVENHGPSDVPAARVVDEFPDSFSSVSWLCSTSGGASCQTSGIGNLDLTVSLPSGSSITIEATGVVSSDATGRLVNTATVSASNVIDPNPDNNSATDDDTVLSPAMDLVISVDDGASESTPGDWVTYTVTGSNLGPSDVRGALIEDQLPASLYEVSWQCEAMPAAGMLDLQDSSLGDLDTVTALTFSGDGRYAYATGTSGGQAAVQTFSRNVIGGSLTADELLVQGQGGVTGIRGASDLVLSGDGRFLYVTGPESDSVVVFGRDSEGQLTQLAQVQDGEFDIQGLGGAHQLLIGPDSAQLYVASRADMAIAVFDIDANTGLLTQAGITRQGINGVDGLNGITGMAWSESGEHLLVSAETNQSLAAFSRDSLSGLLEPLVVILDFELPEDVLVAPSSLTVTGQSVFVADAASARVSEFAFEPDEASLQWLRILDAASAPNLLEPTDLLFDPDQARLYVAGSNGMLLVSLLPETPELIAEFRPGDFGVLDGLGGMTLAPDHGQLYTHSTSSGVGIGRWARERGSRCPIAGTGGLGRHPVDIVSGGQLVYEVRGRIRANASGELAYTVSLNNPLPEQELNPDDNIDTDINQLVPRPDLAIMKTADVEQVVAGESIQYQLEVDNAGISDAMAARVTDLVPVFPDEPAGIIGGSGAWQCEANLPLEWMADYPAATNLTHLHVGQAGHRVYAVSPTTSALWLYPVNGDGGLGTPQIVADGDTLPGGVVSGLAGASAVAVSSDERHVYVAGQQANSLVVLSRETPDSPLRFGQQITSGQGGVSGLLGPVDAMLSADERFVYVAANGSNAIAVFSRDKSDGSLSFVERIQDGLGTFLPNFNVIQGVRKVLPGHSGDHLYAVSTHSETLSAFSVNPDSGALTFDATWRQGESGMAGLAGVLDVAAAPGDSHFYVLGEDGIGVFRRSATGDLEFQAHVANTPALHEPRSISVDGSGARVYLLDAGEAGEPSVIHVFARDWIDGTLGYRYSQPLSTSDANLLVQAPTSNELLVSASTPAGITRLAELALSRCLQAGAAEDDIVFDVDLGIGGWSRVVYDATVHPSARGNLVNTAEIEPTLGVDPDLANNSSTMVTPVLVVSDLTVTKTGPAEAVAGEEISYQIRVTNAGPSDALGFRVQDLAPPQLLDIGWTCLPDGDSSCPSTGTGVPDFMASVPVGDELTIQIDATIDPSFVGELVNAVVVHPEPGATDPNPDGNSDEVATTVTAVADVSVSKQTQSDPVVAGAAVSYQLIVANAGPSDAPVVALLDALATSLSDGEWVCNPSGQASCPSSGLGDVDFEASVPAGDSLELILTAVVAPDMTGVLENRFEATVLNQVEDPDPINNSAEVSDVVVAQPDLALSLAAPMNPFDPEGSGNLPLVATVTNLGPSTARDVTVDWLFSDPAVLVSHSACIQSQTNAMDCVIGTLAPGDTRVLAVELRNLPSNVVSMDVDASVATSGDDPDPVNNHDSVSVQFMNGGDVRVLIDNGVDALLLGQSVTYEVVVENIGSQAVAQTDVSVPIPPELLDAAWTCSGSLGAVCQAEGVGDIVDTVSLEPRQRVIYRLDVQVDPTIDLSTPRSVTVIATADVTPPHADINPVNNIAVAQDVVDLTLFRDRFEAVLETSALMLERLQRNGSACVDTRLQFSSLPRLAGGGSARLFEGQAATGERVIWLDALHRPDGHWLQLSYLRAGGAEASGWQEWPAGETGTRVRIVEGVPALMIGSSPLWHGRKRLIVSPETWLGAPLRVYADPEVSMNLAECPDT